MRVVVAVLVLISIGAASAQSTFENLKVRNTCKSLAECGVTQTQTQTVKSQPQKKR